MPTAITVTPAIWPIRFTKLTEVKKYGDLCVKNAVIAMIPTITGRLPTSPPLRASQRPRSTAVRLSPCAAACTSAGAAELTTLPPPAPFPR